jgi:DNA-directed RNA polymerase specialized sigma24 family protein
MTKGCAYSAKTMAAVGARNAKARVAVHMIEGEQVTYAQMAARLGCTPTQATFRLSQERRKPGAVTWERLKR